MQKPVADYLIALSAFNGLIATALSAVGAHALPADISDASQSFFDTATNFHMFHALAMLGAALFLKVSDQASAKWAAIFYQAGILGFSCSLYWRVFMGEGSLGPFHWITPIGGLFLMVGWFCLVFAGIQAGRRQ
ncbi:DUF423 domain-containing protein [Kordiimonas sp. SCSIO 12610]|uniref:DUF423 domain-containing protein n=1 Tax=Kordiimonas sp. SCSIO 12610 TaxID=2829597 RepID=UPI00210C611E|nr:DUF423 domain-containing protein [Kordiimonas sp. SCSIO 12610]UTW56362.1 DUF423 domain-containing protein [Kordiimonas sp. SCSIO 12610]